jgi:hypothetical protein
LALVFPAKTAQALAARLRKAKVEVHPAKAARPSSRRSTLKSVHWTDLSAFGGRVSLSLPGASRRCPRATPR